MKNWAGVAIFVALSISLLPSAAAADKTLGDYVAIRAIGGFAAVDGISENASGSLTENNTEDFVGGIGIALGYDWLEKGLPFRTEISYHHRFRFDLDTRIIDGATGDGYENNLSTDVVLVNFFYDINLGPNWRPFVGFGVGWARNTSDVVRDPLFSGAGEGRTDTTDNVAWAAGLGTVYRISDTWQLELAYRYIDLGTIEMGPFNNGAIIEAEDYISHDIVLGFQFRF